MARFKITSKNGRTVRYEGKPKYIGTYLKPSYLEFSDISVPSPIKWEIGDYVDYPRTGMRYRLYSVPQPTKRARRDSCGNAFSYSNVQFHAATKELEIAPLRDLVLSDNNIHFSTSPEVATFENLYGIASRIQACMDDLYPGRWEIKVADFDENEDADILEKIREPKEFALSGGTCLDALSKIYELWQDIGWIHWYDSVNSRDVITIGYANKRLDANTTDNYVYGKGNGLTAITKIQTNKEEFATRLYVYGSERNLPARYYNEKDILNADSVDIRNLMLPIDKWGKTDRLPDARKAYLENSEAVAKYGVIPKTHYFDSPDAGADIYPSIEGMTVGDVRKSLDDMGIAEYRPSVSIYPSDSERVDEVLKGTSINDDGVINANGQSYDERVYEDMTTLTSIGTVSAGTTSGKVGSMTILSRTFSRSGWGKISIIPDTSRSGRVYDYGYFKSVKVTLELTDSITKRKTISVMEELHLTEKDADGCWPFQFPSAMTAEYKGMDYSSFNVYLVITVSAELIAPVEADINTLIEIDADCHVEYKRLLHPTFTMSLKQVGFDINDRAKIGEGKTISMKTGACAGRDFEISKCVYKSSSDSWELTLKRQQDDTLGMLFPNSDYQIGKGDRFVLIDIAMPELYIRANMEKLLREGEKLLARVSKIQSHYEPSIDAKVMIESGRHLREGMFMEISDDDIIDGSKEYILIDTLNIYEDEASIPTYRVTLRERRKVTYKGTPSSTTSSRTKSVSDGEEDNIDLSSYAKREYVDEGDAALNVRLSDLEKIKNWFELSDDNTTLTTRFNLASEGQVSGGGAAGGAYDPETGSGLSSLDGLIDVEIDFGGLSDEDRKHQGLRYDNKESIWKNTTIMKSYHHQGEPSKVWRIVHNMGKFPNVKILDSVRQLCMADVVYVDENTVQITFGSPESGSAYLD